LACITLDFELDYGDRIGEFNILQDHKSLTELSRLFSSLAIPVSAFVRTDVPINYPHSVDIIKSLAQDYHSHSHTHNMKHFDSEAEISATVIPFEKTFGKKPMGYRAPHGILREGDVALLKKHGFRFSSSIFPSYRFGQFNNLSYPLEPFLWDNGIMELPFAVVPFVRTIISLSYLKLLGWGMNKTLFSLFGLPDVVVFDSHLHDYFCNEHSYNQLPLHLRMAWGMRRHAGIEYLKRFVELLRNQGYRFLTMTELYDLLSKGAA